MNNLFLKATLICLCVFYAAWSISPSLDYHRLEANKETKNQQMKVKAQDLKLAAPSVSDADWMSISGIPGTNGEIKTILAAKERFYIGGFFTLVSNTFAKNIAEWNGTRWNSLGSGINGWVTALAVDRGGMLYAGGIFDSAGGVPAKNIARWNGTKWEKLGSGITGASSSHVDLLVCDDKGSLYATGAFDTAGGVFVDGFAKWNGVAWSLPDLPCQSLGPCAYDSSGRLNAIGFINNANYLFRFNENGFDTIALNVNGLVWALTFDKKGAPYIGGNFDSVGGSLCKYVAKWDGNTWKSFGASPNKAVTALSCDTAGNVFAGGNFDMIGQIGISHIAQWDGSTWRGLGKGINGRIAGIICQKNGNCIAAGSFDTVDGQFNMCISSWNGEVWSAIGPTTTDQVLSIVKDGKGALYVGGKFTTICGTKANHIVKWDGSAWTALGMGVNNEVTALAIDNKNNLFAGGKFDSADNHPARHIAKWDGASWQTLGSGTNKTVWSLAFDKNGNLYAGGEFDSVNDINTGFIAQWDGSVWRALGPRDSSGAIPASGGSVSSLAFDLNGGLYAAGYFPYFGGRKAQNIARWDGNTWNPLDSGYTDQISSIVFAKNGDLYASGAQGTIALWNKSGWQILAGTNVHHGPGPYYYAHSAVNSLLFDANGILYAGGVFDTIDRRYPANNIAAWDGKRWSSMGSGVLERINLNRLSCVNTLALFDSLLYIGGYFDVAGKGVSCNITCVNIHTTANRALQNKNMPSQSTVRYRLIKKALVFYNISHQDHIFLYSLSGRCVRHAQGVSRMNLSGLAPQLLFIRIYQKEKILLSGMVESQ